VDDHAVVVPPGIDWKDLEDHGAVDAHHPLLKQRDLRTTTLQKCAAVPRRARI